MAEVIILHFAKIKEDFNCNSGSAGTVRRKDGEGEETYEEHMGRGSPRKVCFHLCEINFVGYR